MLALNENIRRLRRAAGLSQEELAGRLGVSRQSVSLWEQGVTHPTVENIYAMAEVLERRFEEYEQQKRNAFSLCCSCLVGFDNVKRP